MQERIKKILKGQLTTSIIYILLGLCLAFAPVSMVNIICKFVFGILLVAAGLYHVLIYVMEKANVTILDLFSGAIILVLGVFLFWNPQIVIKLLPMLLGAFVLIDSIWTLKGCFRLKKHGSSAWKVLLIGSLVFIAFGIVLIVNPFKVVKTVVIFAGAVLLANGVVDIVFMIMMNHGIKEIVDNIETEQTESAEGQDSNEPEQFTQDSEKEAVELAETYEPWNGVTAAASKPVKESIWKKLKKDKGNSAEMPTEEVPQEVVEEPAQEVSREVPRDVVEEVPKEVSQEVVEETSQNKVSAEGLVETPVLDNEDTLTETSEK